MLVVQCAIETILSESSNSSELLRKLYMHKKANNSKFSLEYICRKTGISSKGHLSYMMQGKRRIRTSYWESLAAVFNLTDAQALTLITKMECAEPGERAV